MSGQKEQMIYKRGKTPSEGGYPGKRSGNIVDRAKGIRCEYDVPVTMRDGVKIYANIFRPEKNGNYPALIAFGPYGKHNPPQVAYAFFAGCGQSDAENSEYCIFEGPDPAYWCPYGYVIINVDPRGDWGSEGDLTYMTEQEARDGFDLVEWAGTQPWSNGKVGMSGVSYLAWSQYKVAALNPPHLAAICPWEGVSDFYRELFFHGGIPCNFVHFLNSASNASTRMEDLAAMAGLHPLFDDYWAGKNADLSKITVPSFVVASWSDHGLHNRGTLEAFKKISSKQKWLRVHGRKKWPDYYQHVERQRQFFDKFLKGIASEVDYWPKVSVEIRERYFVGNFRGEKEWPLARTQYTKLFLNASNGTSSEHAVAKESQIRYNVDDASDQTQNAQFDFVFDKKTELTGHSKLKLWVQADGCDDMDLFVTLEKIDRTGDRVAFPTQTMFDNGPAAYGWLRVSHRELDEKKSTDYQPVLKHQRELKLKAGEIVPVEIEIWPTSILFEKGEKLRVVVLGSDLHAHPFFMHEVSPINRGKHVILTGGKYDSHLLMPVIP